MPRQPGTPSSARIQIAAARNLRLVDQRHPEIWSEEQFRSTEPGGRQLGLFGPVCATASRTGIGGNCLQRWPRDAYASCHGRGRRNFPAQRAGEIAGVDVGNAGDERRSHKRQYLFQAPLPAAVLQDQRCACDDFGVAVFATSFHR